MEGVLEGQDMSREPLGLWGRAPTHCALTGMTRGIGSSLFLHSFCLKHLLLALPVPLWSKPLLGASKEHGVGLPWWGARDGFLCFLGPVCNKMTPMSKDL